MKTAQFSQTLTELLFPTIKILLTLTLSPPPREIPAFFDNCFHFNGPFGCQLFNWPLFAVPLP